jgi:hypothetical protein
MASEYESMTNGHYEYENGTKVSWVCKKCPYHDWRIE